MPICHLERDLASAALDVRENYSRRGWLDSYSVKQILQNHATNFLGKGYESFVLETHFDDRGIAAAFSYFPMSELMAKETYYLHRLFHTLFPHNFPRFYAVWQAPTADGPYALTSNVSIRQRITGVTHRDGYRHLDEKSTFPFGNVRDLIASMEIPQSREDLAWFNFLLAADGGVYYLDVLRLDHTFQQHHSWPIEKIIAYMKRVHHSPEDIHTVKMCIKRLQWLNS